MARILYIFPHPDDESFGPAPAIASQLRNGHEVFLQTLTRGGATKQRHRLGLTIDEMGEIRLKEMQCVERALGLSGMTVLDMPDGGLADLDPQDVEAVIRKHIRSVTPDVVVTYAVHGISGHPDHLVCHQVVKRVFAELRDLPGGPRRLAFFTLPPDDRPGRPAHLRSSSAERLAVRIAVTEDDLRFGQSALACYETYQSVVDEHRPLDEVRDGVYFEIYQEDLEEIVDDLTAGMA